MLIAGLNELNCFPSLFRALRCRNVNPRNVNAVCSYEPRRSPVLAVHDPGLVGMQPQPDLLHPLGDRRHHLAGLGFADAVHDRVIHVTFERDAGNSRAIHASNA